MTTSGPSSTTRIGSGGSGAERRRSVRPSKDDPRKSFGRSVGADSRRLTDREGLAGIFGDVDIHLRRVTEGAGPAAADTTLTAAQRAASSTALDDGYSEDLREVTLDEGAAALGPSQPAAGGLLRRGIKRLLLATAARDDYPSTSPSTPIRPSSSRLEAGLIVMSASSKRRLTARAYADRTAKMSCRRGSPIQ